MKTGKEETVRKLEEFVKATDRFLGGVFQDGVVVDPETHEYDPSKVLDRFSTDRVYIPRDREESGQLALSGFETETDECLWECDLEEDLRKLYTSMVLVKDEARFILACLKSDNATDIARSLQRRLHDTLGHCEHIITTSFDPDMLGANSEAVVEKAGDLVTLGQDVSARIGALSSSAR
ncbi:MAG: hypothetical protein PHD72_00440 [Patescibacteria group bacterium]|nr:hypothetical protein [Patescibacteria group bacterium]